MDPLIAIGQPAPDFTLYGLDGAAYRLSQQRGRIVILNFWSAECPWSERADAALLADLAGWGPQVALWPVASNANEPPELLARVHGERGLPRLLLDPNRQVADLYGAQTTPHLFVIDPLGQLRYQGAFNDVTFRQRTPTRFYLREAVHALLAGRDPAPSQTPPYGCSIVRYV